MFSKTFVVGAVLLATCSHAQAQDGARAYHPVPKGTNFASLTVTAQQLTIAGSEFGVAVVTPSYQGYFELAGTASAFLIGMPIGSLSAALDTGFGIVNLETDVAPGDMFIGGQLGLFGSPSLGPMDYAQYKPGLQAIAAAKLFLPTGDYDSSRLLNLGGNRWSLQASLPISYILADTLLDPDLTTFELVPSVHIFGDNDDPFGSSTVASQEPLFLLEAHVTRNFGPSVWAALDGYYVRGGETSSNGVPDGNAQETLSLGATLGLVLSPSLAMRASYVEQVYSTVSDSSFRSVRVTSAYRF
ncbi:Putative MetA-pathway of phenol degradation [Devosia enhydra]|uniref:Putative MetA-pathway of phenol degradation n=1 Tax=Devosia enhydra TaxID=665118 RepID=A0A1K2HVV2_9HYPH|nr:transporter [Devosia enhydra]SFZ82750.1 Putative MetA-pathway of phenol degradation [Devosia enhydra]